MRYRYVSILEPEDLGASGTKVIDIKLLDVISRMSVIFSTDNAAAGLSDHPAANVSKIELIDGSEVLFSLSGKQAQGVSYYQTGKMPYNSIDAINGHTQTVVFDLNFGRYLWDTELAFDPKKFRNPQLRITYNEAVSQTSTTSNSCRVVGYVFDETQPAPRGMLRSMEQYSYGLSAGTKAYVTLPTDHVLRELYVHCLEAGNWFATNVSHFKISEESGKRVPIDWDYTPLALHIMERYGWIGENAQGPGVTSDTNIYTAVCDYAVAKGVVQTEKQDEKILPGAGGQHTYASELASGRVSVNIEGLLPHGVMPLLNLIGEDIGNWYDVHDIKTLELILTHPGGATGGQTVSVLTEQLYRY